MKMTTKKELKNSYAKSGKHRATVFVSTLAVVLINVYLLEQTYQPPIFVTFLFTSVLAYVSMKALLNYPWLKPRDSKRHADAQNPHKTFHTQVSCIITIA